MAVFCDQPLMAAASAQNTAGTIDLKGEPIAITIYVKAGAGVSAGVVSVEEADSADYTGTWSVLATVSTTVASAENAVRVAGPCKAIRTRISTAITGGTVSTYIVAATGE